MRLKILTAIETTAKWNLAENILKTIERPSSWALLCLIASINRPINQEDICEKTKMKQSIMSHRLSELSRLKLLNVSKAGRYRYYTISNYAVHLFEKINEFNTNPQTLTYENKCNVLVCLEDVEVHAFRL